MRNSSQAANSKYDVRLHSHDVRYGSGSGQQSITGVQGSDDTNSYWQIKMKTGVGCTRGQPIACGDTIRIHHLTTKKNLHSHLFAAPMTNSAQEVSAFGDNGVGDEGDHWNVICQSSTEHQWKRSSQIRLRHASTGAYLQASGEKFSRPIQGQYEIVAMPSLTPSALWQAGEGIFVTSDTSDSAHSSQQDHDEL